MKVDIDRPFATYMTGDYSVQKAKQLRLVSHIQIMIINLTRVVCFGIGHIWCRAFKAGISDSIFNQVVRCIYVNKSKQDLTCRLGNKTLKYH